MPKISLKESLINMFGEFISMNKNPDFKLSDESSQYIIKSIRDEKRRKKMEMFNNPEKYFEPKHFRTRSNNSQGLDKQMEHTYHCRSQSFSPRSSEFATSGTTDNKPLEEKIILPSSSNTIYETSIKQKETQFND